MVHPAATKAQAQQAATPAPTVQQPNALGAYFGSSAVPNGSFLTSGTPGLSRSKFLS